MNCLDAAFGPPKKWRQTSMKACGRMRWRIGRVRGKRGNIVSEWDVWHAAELSDLARPGTALALCTQRGEGWKERQQRWRVEKARQRRPPFSNHAGQLSTFIVKEIRRVVSAFGKWLTMNGLEGWGKVEEWRNGRIVEVYALVGWKTEENKKQLQPMIKP